MNPCLFAAASGQVAFLISLPVLAIVGGYFGAYAAHSLFTVIEQTAAGFDRVSWPQESFFDWVGKLIHVLGLLLLLLFPVGFLIPVLDFDGGAFVFASV